MFFKISLKSPQYLGYFRKKIGSQHIFENKRI